jgi:hypothetical protein
VKNKKDWTHFSFLEVHDNISAEEIREIEAMLLEIFCDDPRIELSNLQTGSRKFRQARKAALWDSAPLNEYNGGYQDD